MNRIKSSNTVAVKGKKTAPVEVTQLRSAQKVILLKVDKTLNERAANHLISSKTASLRDVFANSASH